MQNQPIVPPWFRVEFLFNIIVGVVGLASFALDVWVTNDPIRSITNLGATAVILAFFLLYAFWTARKERYADITAHIESVADRCRRSRNRVSATDDLLADDSKFRDDLEIILTGVSTIFSMVTGVRCRAALKAFRPLENGEFYCFTLARDHQSAASYLAGDRRRGVAKFDTLDKNPHLLSLFSEEIDGEDWDVFNDIPKMICERRYVSSSLLWEMKISHTARGTHEAHSLPYSSAVTALTRNRAGAAVAFIGVDTSARNVFRTRSDGALLAALGGYIGPLLEQAFDALPPDTAASAKPPQDPMGPSPTPPTPSPTAP